MLTKEKLATEAGALALNAAIMIHVLGTLGVILAAVLTVALTACNIALWRHEAPIRAHAAEVDFVPGQPLIHASRFGGDREVVYVGPCYTSHLVRKPGFDVDLHVQAAELRAARTY